MMMLKKILAVVTAAALTVTNMAVTSFTASAASLSETPVGTETVLYTADLTSVKTDFTGAWDNGDWTQIIIDADDRATIMTDTDVYIKATMSNMGGVDTGEEPNITETSFDTLMSWGFSGYTWMTGLKWYNNSNDGANFECNLLPLETSTADCAIAYAPISDTKMYDCGGIAGNLQCGHFKGLKLDKLEIVKFTAEDDDGGNTTTTTKIWEGSKAQGTDWGWNPAEVSSSNFADVKAGDKLSISFTLDDGAGYSQLKLMASTSPESSALPGMAEVQNEYGTIDVSASPYEYTLTEEDVAIVKENNFLATGFNVTFTQIDLITTSSGEVDPDAPTTKTLTLRVLDATSWGEAGVTKAAQANTTMAPTGFVVGTTKYGNVKNTTVSFDGIRVNDVSLEDVALEDVEVSLYAQWGSGWTWTSGSADGWDLSTIEGVSDSDVLQQFGYQVNIKGNVGGINDMEVGDTVTVNIEYVGLVVDGEINNDTPTDPDDTPTEADPSKWQVVLYGFGPDWASNWAGTIGEKGVLTAEATIGDIMEKDGVDQYGGIQVQVWGARENDVASYRILVKGADGKFVKVNTQGTHTFAATDTGLDTALGQFCMPICWGTYSFDPSDVITVVVAEGETVPALPGSGSTGGGVVSGGSSGTSTPTTPSTPDDGKTEVIDPETLPVKFTDGDNNTGAEVAAPEGAFDDGVKFNAVPVAEDTNNEDKFTFDFSFTDKDGKEVQPKAAVTVSVPVPTALIGKTVFVYHIENDGKYTEINCKVEDGKILFTVSGFSKYVITSQKLNANGEPAAEQPGTSDPGTTNPGSTNEPNANTGVGGVAAVLGITAIAAAAMIVSKKRK